MMKKIAINGFGRIGRAALKVIMDTPGLEVVAVNDLMTVDNAAYLLQYDSIYGKYKYPVAVSESQLVIKDKAVVFLSQRDPSLLPWKELQIDYVIESTGRFTNSEDAEKHIFAGAKNVIISAAPKDINTPTVIHGVNTLDGKTSVFSCASCTTNNIGPIIEILARRIGIEKVILNTIHTYTAAQSLVDGPSKKEQKFGRAARLNLIPTTTGAAIATIRALPQLKGKFDGISVRTPVMVGSISDLTLVVSRNTSVPEINNLLIEESKTERYRLVLAASSEPIVSSDVKQSSYAAIVDLAMTRVVDGDLVKILAWYDNEWGFTNQMIRQITAQ